MLPDHIRDPRRASLDALHARAVKTVSRVMKSDKEFAQLKAAEIVLARTAPIPREPVQVHNNLGVLAVTPDELAGLLRRHAERNALQRQAGDNTYESGSTGAT